MFEGFPYTNFHELNLDWIIKIVKDFLDQYTHIQEIIETGEATITDQISDGIEQLETKATEIEALLDAWYETHSEDIAQELAEALETFNTQAVQRALEVISTIPLDYSALSETVQNLNCNNMLNAYTKTTETVNGITYTWSGNYCSVQGTASALSFNNIYNNASALPAGMNPGDLFYAGAVFGNLSGLEIYSVDANADVRQIFYSPNTYPTDYITIPSDAVGLIVRIRVDSGVTVNENIYPYFSITPTQFDLDKRTLKLWAAGDCVFLKETTINQARQPEINALLTQYKHVVLLEGTFYINGSIIIPEGCTLSGIGMKTHILANANNIVSITLNNNSKVENLWLDGGGSDRPTTLGTRYGIYADQQNQTLWIENCKVSGFDRFGIYIGHKGTGTYPQFIKNCYIELCYYALCIFESDYIQVTNITARNNFCGVFENGGVTKYIGCGFDSNTIGVMVQPTYSNNGHGMFDSCSVCHNSQNGILVENVTNAEIFANCQIHFNDIGIKGTSKGVQFIGCQIGNSVSILFTSEKQNYFNHCLFWVTPTITMAGTGTLKFHECYNIQTGDLITP